MARRRTKKFSRKMILDSRYNSDLVTKFINCMMYEGKKSVAEGVFYGAIDYITEKMGEDGYGVFVKALENVQPQVEVKSRRVGGVTYQVPVEVYPVRKRSLAIRWVLGAARSRNGKSMQQKLGSELMDAFNNTGGAMKKKDEVRRMAEANRAFSHYAW